MSCPLASVKMRFFGGFLVCLAASVGVIAEVTSFSGPLEDRTDIFAQLAPLLSPGATIILPGDPLIARHQRWQAYSQPRYSAVVEVATEADVSVVVGLALTKCSRKYNEISRSDSQTNTRCRFSR